MNETLQIVQIGDLIQTKNDKSKQLQSNDYQSNGVLPVVDQGAKPVCGYTNDLSKRYNKGLPVIIFGDHTLHTKFIDFNFAIGADGTQVVVPKNHDCDTKYLYYLISRAANLIGSEGYKRHFKILKEFDIEYIEPLPAQQKIAAILSSVDDVIEKTRAQIDKLKDLKTGMMQELLTKGIGSGGVPHTEFKDSPVGRIPTAWKVAELRDLLGFISYGFTNPMPEAETGPFMVTAKDVSDLCVQYNSARKTTTQAYNELLTEKSRPKINDILLTKDGTLGRVALVERTNICINQSVAVLRPNEKVIPKFLLYLLASPPYQREMLDKAGGSTIKHIYITVVDKMKVAVPTMCEQENIVEVLDALFRKISLAEEKLRLHTAAKKALMQDLLTGKIRVKVDQEESAVA